VVGEGCRYAGGYDGNDVARHVDQQIGSSLGKREQAFKAFYRTTEADLMPSSS
jgi:hypothetical protein